MVHFATSEEWQQQTSLLLKARPTTTRITTKYNIPNSESRKYQQKLKKRKRDADGEGKNGAAGPFVPRATLTLKTYDSESGVVLKFKTDRAQDVARLITGLGRAGRHMAALPEKEETQDAIMDDAQAHEHVTEPAVASAPVAVDTTTQQGSSGAGGGGGKKKKSKNKK